MSDAANKNDATRKDVALKFTMPGDMSGRKALIEQLACTIDSQTGTIEQLHRDKEELKLTLVERTLIGHDSTETLEFGNRSRVRSIARRGGRRIRAQGAVRV